MVDFVNPGYLGSSSSFKYNFVEPILRGRDPLASFDNKELGNARAAKLGQLTATVILRRTAEVNNAYLPEKCTQVVFCRPTTLQLDIYRKILNSKDVILALGGDGGCIFPCITNLQKLCNHPGILQTAKDSKFSDLVPEDPPLESSGKFVVLTKLLEAMRDQTTDRIVIVSNYTQTLDYLSGLCKSLALGVLRLDGQTSIQQRGSIVNRFNLPSSNYRVFLLSTKAGGVGLNLIGANRLVLYDSDWNPANDKQAMARIWRDGQKKKVFIYRFLTTGTIEEKIFQRQVSKQGLSDAIMDEKKQATKITKADLKRIFTLDKATACSTHDLIRCPCQLPSRAESLCAAPTQQQALMDYDHIFTSDTLQKDPVLADAWASSGCISCVFQTENDDILLDGANDACDPIDDGERSIAKTSKEEKKRKSDEKKRKAENSGESGKRMKAEESSDGDGFLDPLGDDFLHELDTLDD